MSSLEHRYPLGVVVAFAVLTGCPLRGHAAPPPPLQNAASAFGISAGSAGAPTLWKIPSNITYTDNGPAPADVGEAVALYQPYLDQFSWRMFIAVNWPSLPTGKANQNRWIGAEGDGPTVWEHWMNADDLFRKGGEPPPPWGTPPPVPPECRGLKLKDIFAPVVFSQDDDSFTTHNDPSVSNKDSAYIQAGQTGPLVDQSGRWTRFEIYVNEVFYDYVTKNKLYSREGQQKFKDSGQAITVPEQAIEIKVAWKVVDEKADKDKYHEAQGLFVKKDGTCEKVAVGLVALHIVSKPPRSPNRVWATFEHESALCQRNGDNYSFTSGSYCNAACLNDPNASCGKPNTAPPKPWIPPANPAEPGKAAPTQVIRTNPVPIQVGQLNSLVQSFLGGIDQRSVWPHYKLIGTQWVMAFITDLNTSPLREWYVNPGMGPAPQYLPTMPDQAKCTASAYGNTRRCLGLVQPPLLASSLIETYMQPGSSCVGCHEQAKTTAGQDADFSFVLQQARGK